MKKVIVVSMLAASAVYAESVMCSKCESDEKAQPRICSCCGVSLSAEKSLAVSYELLAQRFSSKMWDAMLSCTNVPYVPVSRAKVDFVTESKNDFVSEFQSLDSSARQESYNTLKHVMENPDAFSVALQSARASGMAHVALYVYGAITQSDVERKELGLGLKGVWPSSTIGEDKEDISGKLFQNSTGYFQELMDLKNREKKTWSPYIGCKTNIVFRDGKAIWIIARADYDEVDDVVPVLVSANVDASSLLGEGVYDAKELSGALRFSGDFAIIVRKSGKILVVRHDHSSRLSVIYESKKFSVPKGFSYLTP